MNRFEQYVKEHGIVLPNDVLKVDSFLNHQIDPEILYEIGNAFAQHFQNCGITKVVTIESSGIAPALFCAKALHVPMIFIKKALPSTMENPASVRIFSYTKKAECTLVMEKCYLSSNDTVLFIDDFLANGEAFQGAKSLVEQCGARIYGAGIVIEKVYQKGHNAIVSMGYDLFTLVKIQELKEGQILFQ